MSAAPKAAAERDHALLSASASHRWLHCTPSVRLEEKLPEATSDYAEEGRLAHEIAELKLRKHFTPMGSRAFTNALKKLQAKPHYSSEMLSHTDTYLEYIQQTCHAYDRPPYVAIERRVDYSHIAPEGFGTADCIIIGGNVLQVVDFKYGAGVPVSAEQNPQMMLYALGALQVYAMLYAIEIVRMAIVQPRLTPSISEYEIPVDELRAWGEQIRPTAQAAFDGKGEYCPGDWCRFCRAKGKCRAQAETYTSVISAFEAFGGARTPLITNEELGEILLRAQPIVAWVKSLEEHALTAILRGEPVPGWKAVEGRSNRTFNNTDEAFKKIMEAGYEETVLYKREPITLTEVEKLLGKKLFSELLAGYVIKPSGKPTLAPETDKREAINLIPTAAEAFSEPA